MIITVKTHKSCLKAALTALFFLSTIVTLRAQYYDIGEDAASVRWQRAKSENFEIIFPGNGGARATKYLGLMEKYYGVFADSVKYNYGISRRFPMIMHAYNANSNGVTVWAPRQIDFYAMPSPNALYPQDWDASLALHEGRHAWQIAHFNNGVFKGLYWLMGDQIIGAASGIYPSSWMLEGDAVVAETELSTTGRGRSGAFIQKILRQIDDGPRRGWDNWRLGSLKYSSLTPYELGYMVNGLARYSTGDYNLTHKILTYEARHFADVKVLASAFRRYAGRTHKDFVKDSLLQEFVALNTNYAMERYADSLAAAGAAELASSGDFGRGAKNGYHTEFSNLTSIGRDSLLALVTGSGSASYLTLLTYRDGRWHNRPLRYMNSTAGLFAKDDDHIYWSEITPNPRWGQASRSRLFSYSLTDGSVKPIRLKAKYLYSPKVSQGKLYTIEYTPAQEGSIIHEYDLKSRARLRSFRCSGQALEVCTDGSDVYYTQIENDRTQLMHCNTGSYNAANSNANNSNATPILDIKGHTMRNLVLKGDTLYFISDYFGGQYLCRYNLTTQHLTLASYEKDIESFDLADGGAYIFLSKHFGSKGAYPLKAKAIEAPLDLGMEFRYPMAEELSRQYQEELSCRHQTAQATDNAGDNADDTSSITIKRYRKGLNLFRIHSWLPIYSDLNLVSSGGYDVFDGEATLGATIYSQNKLGTAVAMAGYSYEDLEQHAGHFKFAYSGFYPVIDATLHFNTEKMIKKGKHSLKGVVNVYIPWNFNRNGWLNGITPQVAWSYRNNIYTIDMKDTTLAQIDRHQILSALSAYSVLPTAKSQVFPRWGIGVSFRGAFTPNGGENFGSVYGGYIYGYLPGLTFNQGLKWSATYQEQDVNGRRYWLDNLFSQPRGYTEDIYGTKYYKLSADYAIPIYLGDVSLGLLAYLKQLDITPFVDYARVRQTDGWHNISSFGSDFMLRAHFFRIGFPISVGVRYARTSKPSNYINSRHYGSDSKNWFGLLFGITIK